MANKILDQALPVPLMLKSSYPDEAALQESLSENISEASSHDSFYDSFSDLNEESFPELSAFLSQDEMDKSLDIAREAFSGSKHEEPFQEHFVNPPSLKSEGFQNRDNLRLNVHNHQNTIPKAPCKVGATDVRKMISPLLTTSPSIIRTLQAQKASKNMRKCDISKTPIPKARAKAFRGDTGAQNNECAKAATFIDELSAIFRETTKARNRRSNGDSSSPDSGYLSPKKDMPSNTNSSVSENEVEIKQELIPKDRQCIKVTEHTFQELQSQLYQPEVKVIDDKQCIKETENSFQEIQSRSNQPEEKVIHGTKYTKEIGNSFQENQSQSNLPEKKVNPGIKYNREMGNSFQEIQSQSNQPEEKVIHSRQCIKGMENSFQKIQSQSNQPEEKVIHGPANKSDNPLAAARFIQKLKSQEVAEGSRVKLECRATGNPLPEIR
ncbi:hypothetical protein XELAEV_18009171mg [Xenopus laevis]|nr:hypothetical protein XELAEV_18009171mg [Xenopus laevis]